MCIDQCECGKSSGNTRQVQPFSVQPAHFHVYDMMKGQLKQRHDVLKVTLHRLLSDIGAHVAIEPQLTHSSPSAVQSLRADLCVTTANGKKYVDLSIVRPSGHEFVSKCRSDIHPGKACEVAARDKVVKYTGAMPEGCTDSDFVPLVYETYGAATMPWSGCDNMLSDSADPLDYCCGVVSYHSRLPDHYPSVM